MSMLADERPPLVALEQVEMRFGNDTVLDRERTHFGGHVHPGRHRFEGHDVVWWDPAALALDQQEQVGIRQQKVLEADKSGVVAEEGMQAHARWQERRRDALERGGAPSRRVRTATALAAERAGSSPTSVHIEEADSDRSSRSDGRRFGVLVHASLAALDLQTKATRTYVRDTVAAEELGREALGIYSELLPAGHRRIAHAEDLLAACSEAGAVTDSEPQ